jgi:FtsZ-interacting cell division protein ZipA
MHIASLRWILLLAGLLFLAALVVWEKRKPRQAPEDSAKRYPPPRSEPEYGDFSEPAAQAQLSSAMHTGARSGSSDGRRPVAAPTHVDLPTMEAIRDQSILAEIDALQMYDHEALLSAAPSVMSEGSAAETHATEVSATEESAVQAAATPARMGSATTDAAVGVQAAAEARAAFQAQIASGAAGAAPTKAAAPMVDWPPDGARHIVALRIVAASEERLSGRAVRLAITACGFVHGRYGIYHQPDCDGRALLSVASLSKPGVLDPINIDFQRLQGLSLFTVLPGPLPPAAALDHLIDTARELSQRLPARLQDEQGQPLNAERLEDLRDSMQSLSIQGLSA